MENLLKQIRVRFTSLGQDSQEDPNSAKERKIPPEKTSSFKGESKKPQNWFRRQFAHGTTRDYDSSDRGEYATAIAAAAFAIHSLEEADLKNKKKISGALETPLAKVKSKKEDGINKLPDPGKKSKRFTDEASIKKPERVDSRKPESEATIRGKTPEKAPSRVPTIKSATDTRPRPTPLPTVKSTLPTAGEERKGNSAGIAASKADAWEKVQMAKIKKRYEKMISTILSWEDEKKVKARSKMNKTERDVEQKTTKASQHYRNSITRIDKVAEGARAQVEERRRNEEAKAKEKAAKMRSTAKDPVTCFCF